LTARHAEKPESLVGRQPAASTHIALVEPPIDQAPHSNCNLHGADVTIAYEGEDLTEPPRKPDMASDGPGEERLLTIAEMGDLFAVPERTVHHLLRGLRLPNSHRYVVVPESVRYSAVPRRQWAEAHGLGEWVVLDEAIQGARNECGVQAGVIRFLLAWDGVRYFVEKPFLLEKLSDAYRKKIKRRVQKKERPNDAPKMIKTISAEWKRLGELRQLQTLFELTPLPPDPQHGLLAPRWLCCFDLRNYFSKVTGQPQMKHVARVLFPNLKPESVDQGWSRNKPRFREVDGDARLETLLRFYVARSEKIRISIKTGIPLWELDGAEPAPPKSPRHERAAAVRVAPVTVAVRPLSVTLRRGLCSRCGVTTEWVVGSGWTPCDCGALVALSEDAPPISETLEATLARTAERWPVPAPLTPPAAARPRRDLAAGGSENPTPMHPGEPASDRQPE